MELSLCHFPHGKHALRQGKMKNNLSDAENIYTTLIKRFSEYSEQNKIKAISDAEATINLLNEIITTLEVK